MGLSYSVGTAQLIPLANHPDTQGWQDLLAEDLSNCQFREGTWVLEDGVLSRKGGDYIWTKGRYGDFILDLEYKVGAGANSGVFIRTGSIQNWLNTAIEVQIHDTTDGTKYGCAGPFTSAWGRPKMRPSLQASGIASPSPARKTKYTS